MKKLTFLFYGTESQTWEEMDKKAIENGFNPGYKYDYGQMWPMSDGSICFENFYYRYKGEKRERFHLVAINKTEKEMKDKKMAQLAINND